MKSFAITIASILLALLAGCCSSPIKPDDNNNPSKDNLTKEDILAIDKATTRFGGTILETDEFIYNSPFIVLQNYYKDFTPIPFDQSASIQFSPNNNANGSMTVFPLFNETTLNLNGSYSCQTISWKIPNVIESSLQLDNKQTLPYGIWDKGVQFIIKDFTIVRYEQIGKHYFDRKELDTDSRFKVTDKALLVYQRYGSNSGQFSVIDIILVFRRKKS